MSETSTKQSKYVALVVLYKREIIQSETIRSLLAQTWIPERLTLIIWDNSPQAASLASIESLKQSIPHTIYISRPENVWLSKVYNEVFATFPSDYTILFDQDTQVPPDYFRVIEERTMAHPGIRLFLPLVKAGERIVSPGNFWIFKGRHWTRERRGLIPTKNLLAITSGMVVAHQFINSHQYAFDERLNLYGIDSKFLLDFSKHERLAYILPVTFAHNSALWSNPTAESLLPRFRNFRKAWATMLSDRPLAHILTKLHTSYVSLKLAIKYRDARFLRP